MARIPDKATMYALLAQDALGNHFQLWPDETALLAAVAQGFTGLVGVRAAGRTLALPYATKLEPDQAIAFGRQLTQTYGCPVRYSEASPDHLITIQGELADHPEGYALTWTTAPLPLKRAFAVERHFVFDYHLPAVIRQHFSEADLHDLARLFEAFPGCVVEFSAYSQCVGVWPGRLVAIWEARNY